MDSDEICLPAAVPAIPMTTTFAMETEIMSPNNDLDNAHRLPSGRTFLKQAPALVPAATGAAVALPPPAPAPAGDNVLAALWRERQDAYNAPKFDTPGHRVTGDASRRQRDAERAEG